MLAECADGFVAVASWTWLADTGFLAHLMLLLDDTSGEAHVVDPSPPPSVVALHDVLTAAWPRLVGRVHSIAAPLESFAFTRDDVVVSSHACGALTDRVLECAAFGSGQGRRVALLPRWNYL